MKREREIYKKNKIKIAAEQNSITSLAWIVSFNM